MLVVKIRTQQTQFEALARLAGIRKFLHGFCPLTPARKQAAVQIGHLLCREAVAVKRAHGRARTHGRLETLFFRQLAVQRKRLVGIAQTPRHRGAHRLGPRLRRDGFGLRQRLQRLVHLPALHIRVSQVPQSQSAARVERHIAFEHRLRFLPQVVVERLHGQAREHLLAGGGRSPLKCAVCGFGQAQTHQHIAQVNLQSGRHVHIGLGFFHPHQAQRLAQRLQRPRRVAPLQAALGHQGMHAADRHRLAIGGLHGQWQSAVIAPSSLVPLACGLQRCGQSQPAFPMRGGHLRGHAVEMHHLRLSAQLTRQMPRLQPASEMCGVPAQQRRKTLTRRAHLAPPHRALRPQQSHLGRIWRLHCRLGQRCFSCGQVTVFQRLLARFERVVFGISHVLSHSHLAQLLANAIRSAYCP